MSRGPILFIASNDTHVRMFAPVADILVARGHDVMFLSMDDYYGQGAHAAARSVELTPERLQRTAGPVAGGSFYRRPLPIIWLDVLRARPVLRRVLRSRMPDVVVVGNDRGLLEKLALREARRIGCRTVLVQDGRLAPRPRPASVAGTVARRARRLVSSLLSAAGLSYLSSSEYGGSGVDVICANGAAGARLLALRSRGRSRVIITGQPRYDGARHARTEQSERWDAAMFTTPFEHAGLGSRYQDRQLQAAVALAAWATQRGRRIAVKPHPREDADAYRAALGASHVVDLPAGEVMAAAGTAVIGISTLIEESAMVGCPVVVPGALIHGGEFDLALPPREIYPRCDTIDELFEWLERLREDSERERLLRLQVAHVNDEVDWRSSTPASARVANAILES